uniref:Uncharacterized protein n=1 Tax=uncultured prokaryote TaxID=198431 RepID=A0A0H5PZX2_9ZZZZ|nr:hypothetical protein [uncultured prokaryote]
MTETTYVDPDEHDPADEHVVVRIWLHTAEGAVLWGATYERGPFDSLSDLRAALERSVPWRVIERPHTLQTHVVQLPLF